MIKPILSKYYLSCPTAVSILNNTFNLPLIRFDHIAIRSLDQNYYESDTFKNTFEINKFKKMDSFYSFPKYNVNATWYKEQSDNMASYNIPRIFTSWHNKDLSKFSSEIQNKISNNLNLSYNEYLDIYNKNQYIAWTMLFKQDINHVAIEVGDIELVTERLILDGYHFNKEGGIYKISDDKNLIQTSIMADPIKYQFEDKKETVPYVFLEFVQRKNNRDGFEADSANKIFSSTTRDN